MDQFAVSLGQVLCSAADTLSFGSASCYDFATLRTMGYYFLAFATVMVVGWRMAR